MPKKKRHFKFEIRICLLKFEILKFKLFSSAREYINNFSWPQTQTLVVASSAVVRDINLDDVTLVLHLV